MVRANICFAIQSFYNSRHIRLIARACSLCNPTIPLLPHSHIQNIQLQVAQFSGFGYLIFHVNLISKLKPVCKKLHARPHISSAAPLVLVIFDRIPFQPDSFFKPLHNICEIFFLIKFFLWIKSMLANHNERSVVPPSNSYIVNIIKSHARLRHNKRICRRFNFPVYNIGLEIVN